MESLVAMLREHPFLAPLSDEQVEALAGCAALTRFEEGDVLFRTGEPADHFYLMRHGRVALEIPAPQGPIAMQTVDAGDTIGWSWLVPPYSWRFQARALELTRALALDARCLRDKCEGDAGLGYALLKHFIGVMAERLEASRLQILDLYGTGARR